MKRRIISIILIAMLVLGLFPAAASAAGLEGAGTSASPYLVKTKADLNEVRNNLAAYYRLENDITFTAADFASGGTFYNGGAGWQSIADFTGTFDGNNKTITGLKQVSTQMVTGLFAHIGSGSVIKNLNLKECSIAAEAPSSIYVGGIAGSSSGTISNCSFNGTISAQSTGGYTTTSAGGIVGIAYSTVSGCRNSGSITASGNVVYVGGVVGEGDTANIISCSNTGTPSTTGGYCGGIVGSLTDDGKVSKCSNSAALKGSGIAGEVEDGSVVEHSYNTGTTSSAGIASSLNGGVITYCYNTGAITGKSVAGIVNYIRGTSVIEYCYNTGNISASGDRDVYAAGIAAEISYSSSRDCTIINCFNIGTISNTCGMDYYSFTGGIGGDIAQWDNKIENCYNRGNIKYTGGYHGGIAACVYNQTTVKNCYYLDTSYVSNTSTTGVKLTDAQMKQTDTFVGFDFKNDWTMAGNANYPYPELKNMPIVYNPNIGKKCTVAFNSQGGSAVSGVKITYGNKITAPQNPTKSGYSFAGWYKESTCINAWDFSKDTVTKDITLYAKWTYTLPGKPVISAVSASYNSIKIAWKKTALATRYQIYRATSKNGKYSKIAETSSASYIDKNLTTGKTYYYSVKAYYKKNNTTVYSKSSDIKSAKATLPAPAKPTAKKASATSIKLSWGKVTGASGYEILRCETKTGAYTVAATVKGGTKSSYTNTKLIKGKTYYYKIRAYRVVGGKNVYGGYSAIVSAKL